MKIVYYATSNPEKIQIAQTVCSKFGVGVIPVSINIDEIQGEDPEVIVRDKAKRAYEKLGMCQPPTFCNTLSRLNCSVLIVAA